MSSADLTVLRFIEESVIGVTPDDSVKATGTLTASTNFANAETVTIGTKVYTFQTTLTNVDGHVDIGADLTASLLNLLRAINNSGGVPGTDYAASTEAHPSVSAISSNATTLVVRALIGGTAGNSIATTEVCTNAAWGAATLASGADSTITEWNQVRFTGESLNFNIENTKTAEIRPDRTETDLIQTGASGGGDVNFEMSYGSFRDWLQAVLCSTWTGSGTETLENGILLRTYTVQKHFQDMTPEQYHFYRGCAVESMNLNIEVGKIVDGAFNLMSFGIDPDTGITDAQIGGSTFAAVSATSPMNAVTNLQDFTVDGVPYSGCISSLKLQIKNNIRAIKCLGSLTARNMKLGTIEVTGDMEFYFNEGSNYRKFVKGTEFDFSFALEDNQGNRYLLELPRCKFESGEVVAGGKNTDVMFSAKWRGLYDATSDRVMQLTATPA